MHDFIINVNIVVITILVICALWTIFEMGVEERAYRKRRAKIREAREAFEKEFEEKQRMKSLGKYAREAGHIEEE